MTKGAVKARHRPSTPVFRVFAGLVALLVLAGAHSAISGPSQQARIAASAELVDVLGLTDLALFTEARYTRHPSMADLHTPFQDHPMSFEHFPSGIFMPPPSDLDSGTLFFGDREVTE